MSLTVEEVTAILRLKDELSAQLKKSEGNLQSFGANAAKIGAGLSAAVTLPIIAVGASAISMAMNAEEAKNLFDVSFGGMADKAMQWSQTTTAGLIQTETELRSTSATLYNMFSSMGLSEDAAYGMATSLVDLSSDMASFRNLKPEEAFEKLRAGITGQTEPLMALGINVQETTLQLTAMKHGLIKQGEEMSVQQKVMARYLAIMDQTKNDQGDLARTSTSTTNELKAMSKELKEASLALGQALLPTFKSFVEIAKSAIPHIQGAVKWFAELSPSSQKIVLGFVALAAAAGPLLLAFGAIAASVSAIMAVWPALVIAFGAITGPIGLTVAAILGLAAIWAIWGDDIKRITAETFGVVKAWFVDKWNDIVGGVKGGVEKVAGVFAWLKDTLVGHSTVPDMVNLIHSEFDRMGGGMSEKAQKGAAKVAKEAEKMKAKWAEIMEDMKYVGVAEMEKMQAAQLKVAQEGMERQLQVLRDNQALIGRVLADHYAFDINQRWANAKMQQEIAQQNAIALMDIEANSLRLSREDTNAYVGHLREALGQVPGILQRAFEGGGGLGGAAKSLMSNLGSHLGGEAINGLFNKFSPQILSGLGMKMASAIGGLAGPLGSAVGSLIGPLVGKMFSGLFGKSEGRKELEAANADIAKYQDQLLKTYGSIDRIRELGGQAGAALADAWGSQNRDGLAHFKTLLGEFNEEMERQGRISGIVSDILGTKALGSLRELEQAYQQLTPEQMANSRVVDRLVANYIRLRDETGETIPELEELARQWRVNQDATKNADTAARNATGTFAGLTDSIAILQARTANTQAIATMATEFDKASKGMSFNLGTLLSNFDSLRTSLGTNHPAIKALQAAFDEFARTGVWNISAVNAALGLMRGSAAAGIKIPVTITWPGGQAFQMPDFNGGGGGGGGFRPPSSEDINDFIRRNPGDNNPDRIRSAFTNITDEELNKAGIFNWDQMAPRAAHGGEVMRTGLALIHRGETVTPAADAGTAGSAMDDVLAELRAIHQMLRTQPPKMAAAAVLAQR